ncbi:DUF4390 domain-containing protein [candidate division KSB1 bacterium]|nr:DUF4390 domain-containing protein [candidate division KSB1 bacterium]
MPTNRYTLTFGFLFLLNTAVHVWAQTSPIVAVRPYVKSNVLVVRTTFSHLITSEMQETLASGMSTELHFHFKLQSGNQTLVESEQTITLRYQVWERQYSIQKQPTSREFHQYNTFEQFINDSLSFLLAPIRSLPAKQPLFVITAFSPEPISASQQSKLAQWINSSNQISDTKSADGDATFSFNLSALFSIFMGKKETQKMFVHRTTSFTIEGLKQNE